MLDEGGNGDGWGSEIVHTIEGLSSIELLSTTNFNYYIQ